MSSGPTTLDTNQTHSSPLQSSGGNLQPSYGYPASDEIDLVELLGFFWKIKIEIVLGLIFGTVVGAAVAFRVLPVTYKTQIPLVLDKGEIALSDPKKFVENFNTSLNVSDNARAVWRSVFNQSPELARILKDSNHSDEVLAASQALSDKPEKAPLRLRESASPRDFILEIQLPVQGLTPRAGELFSAAIQNAFSSNSSSEVEKQSASKANPSSVPASGVPANSSADESDDVREQLLKARQELLKIEYLCNKLARGLPDFHAFVVSGDADTKSVQMTLPNATEQSQLGLQVTDYHEQISVQGQFERIQRMTAALLAEGRMKNEDATDTVTRAIQVRDDIFHLIPAARREASRTSGLYSHRRVGNRGDTRGTAGGPNLPVLVSASTTGSTLILEEPISKRKIALVLGAFLGAFLGFAFGGLRVFIQKNGGRLREVLAQ